MQAGTRIHKVVHYFLMAPTGGALDRHDHEFDEVRWVDLAEAERLMSHESERRVVADAAAAIERHFPLDAAAQRHERRPVDLRCAGRRSTVAMWMPGRG